VQPTTAATPGLEWAADARPRALTYRVLAHPTEATPQFAGPPPDHPNARLAAAARLAGLLQVADRLGTCGTGPTAWDTRPGREAPLLDLTTRRPLQLLASCRHRLCPRCAPARAAKLAARLGRLMAADFEAQAALVTLTRGRVEGEGVAAAADAILAAFGRLRRTKAWKTGIRGGFFTVEFGGGDGRHVHVHAVADAAWVDQAALLQSWRRALAPRPMGCSSAVEGGVRVERARDTAAVTRYVLKAGNGEALGDAVLPEVLRWMHGRRLMQTFGHLHGKVVADPADEAPRNARVPKHRPWEKGGVNSLTGESVPPDAVEWRMGALL
jgi:hypothetical protein